jgi:hypothetical protein
VPDAASHADASPFLTVIAWPEGWDREAVAQLLAGEAGLDLPTLRLRLGRAPPMIIGQVDAPAAAAAVAALTARGGDAFAPTLADLAALGPTLKIKDMRLVDSELEVDLWNGLSTTIRREQVQILIRAHLRKSAPAAGHPSMYAPGRPASGGRVHFVGGVGLGIGLGAMGLAAAYGASYAANASFGDVRRDVRTSDKLDIHTPDGSVYQIDGDRFAYLILGELRGQGDKANMDKMCELLTHLAPDPIVDPYFPLWRAPAGYQRLRLPEMKRNQDDPAFAFYSRWAALMYRHVMGA